MKKITIMLLSILLLAGCTTIDISKMDYYEIVSEILSKNVEIRNKTFEGYKFYLPQGLKVVEKKNNNLKINSNGDTLYLYVDIVSYYYKEKSEFKQLSSYLLSKKIEYNGKVGYINIVQNDNLYYLEYVFNYAKIETIVPEENLKDVILNSTYILSSIKYNDKIISLIIDENITSTKEEKLDIFKSDKGSSSFLDVIEKYDNYVEDKEEKDQDILEYEELE